MVPTGIRGTTQDTGRPLTGFELPDAFRKRRGHWTVTMWIHPLFVCKSGLREMLTDAFLRVRKESAPA